MDYREPLPENCPPPESEEVLKTRHAYRLVRSGPPTLDDFRSKRAEKPFEVYSGVTECQARGLSVFADRRDAEGKARKLPALRGTFVCHVQLDNGAGRI